MMNKLHCTLMGILGVCLAAGCSAPAEPPQPSAQVGLGGCQRACGPVSSQH